MRRRHSRTARSTVLLARNTKRIRPRANPSPNCSLSGRRDVRPRSFAPGKVSPAGRGQEKSPKNTKSSARVHPPATRGRERSLRGTHGQDRCFRVFSLVGSGATGGCDVGPALAATAWTRSGSKLRGSAPNKARPAALVTHWSIPQTAAISVSKGAEQTAGTGIPAGLGVDTGASIDRRDDRGRNLSPAPVRLRDGHGVADRGMRPQDVFDFAGGDTLPPRTTTSSMRHTQQAPQRPKGGVLRGPMAERGRTDALALPVRAASCAAGGPDGRRGGTKRRARRDAAQGRSGQVAAVSPSRPPKQEKRSPWRGRRTRCLANGSLARATPRRLSPCGNPRTGDPTSGFRDVPAKETKEVNRFRAAPTAAWPRRLVNELR